MSGNSPLRREQTEPIVSRRGGGGGPVALGVEGLPRPAAARADDERGALDAEILEGLRRVLPVALLGEVRHRGLGAAVPHEEGAALGAVVRGLRVLEAALGAVDVGHSGFGGGAFAARMSVSRLTSTSSSTLFPPDSRRRATSSVRSMSM